MKNKFSVLLSVYKNEKPEYLQRALDSLLKQTLLPDEILIVKDGLLTEALEAVLSEYASKSGLLRFLSFKQNRGLGLALRDGVLACKNELIARMDTDDIAYSNRFAKQIAFLEKHPDIALLGSWITEFSQDEDKSDSITKLPCAHEDILQFAKFRNPFRHVTVVFKRSAVLDSGNYRHFLWFEDYDLFVRVLQKGYKTANLPEVLVNVRATEEMFARRGGWKYWKQDIKFQKFLYDAKFISFGRLAANLCIRGCIRIVPNRLRKIFYMYCLRKKK